MEKFQNKYRIPSARLKNWDYRNSGAYFITICTAHREHNFGNVQSRIMDLNEIGELAEKFWAEIPEHFPLVELGNFVIMPNHMHGILIINNSDGLTEALDDALPNALDDALPDSLDCELDDALDDVQTLQCNFSSSDRN